jgi:hypothetical protein
VSTAPGFEISADATVNVGGHYTVSAFHPEAREAQYRYEPNLHRTFNLADGPAGTIPFAVLFADLANSSTKFDSLDERATRYGGRKIDGPEGAESLSYVSRYRKRTTTIVVIDFPNEARVTIESRQDEDDQQIIDFLSAVDLRLLLGF